MQQIKQDGEYYEHWATEKTLRELVDALNGKPTNKSNQGSDATVLKDILHVLKLGLISDKSKKTIDEEIKKLSKETIKEIKKANIEEVEKQIDELVKETKDSNKQDKKNSKNTEEKNEERNKTLKRLGYSVNRGFSSLTSEFRTILGGEVSLADIVTAPFKILTDAIQAFGGIIGGILGGLAGAATSALGLIIGAYEKFGNVVSDLAMIGAGLNMELEDFKNDAAILGVGTEDLAKVMIENASAMIGLGKTTQEGINNFTMLGFSVQDAISEFNNFGLKNSELLEIMAQEIDLRRRSGQDADTIQSELSESMKNLLFETTAMAAITGQDRRDLLRARQERSQDAIVGAYQLSLTGKELEKFKNISVLTTKAFGPLGGAIADAIQYGQATGTGIETNQKLMQLAALAPGELGPRIMEMAKVLDEQIKNPMITTEGMNEAILSLTSDLGEAFKNADLSTVFNVAAFGTGDIQQVAESLLQTATSIQGIDYDPVKDSFDTLSTAIKESNLQKLPSSVEKMARAIEASFLLSVIELAQNIPGIGDLLKGKSLAELPDIVTDLFVYEEIVPMEDKDGNIMRDEKGNELTQVVKKIKTLSDLFGESETKNKTPRILTPEQNALLTPKQLSTNKWYSDQGLDELTREEYDQMPYYQNPFDKFFNRGDNNSTTSTNQSQYPSSLLPNNLIDDSGNVLLPNVIDIFNSKNNLSGFKTQQNDTTDNEPIMNQNNAIPGQKNISTFNEDGSLKPLEELIRELITATNEVARNQKKTTEAIESQ
jgi:hypothetical protein